jgi:GH18 family chitinase
MIEQLHKELKKENFMFVIPLWPYSENIFNYLSRKRFETLANYVDYFNIMTYDFFTHSK